MEGEWDGFGQMEGLLGLVFCLRGFLTALPSAQQRCVPRNDVFDVYGALVFSKHMWEVFPVKVKFWLEYKKKTFQFYI